MKSLVGGEKVLGRFPDYPNCIMRRWKGMKIIGSTDRTPDGKVYRHVSVSRPDRWPSWDEIVEIRYRFFQETSTVVQILPPKDEYVNLHVNTFHLWEQLAGEPEWPTGHGEEE